MILSTNQELRLILPSNAVDEIANLQGVLDNSEKDFLQDKLGKPLYTRLCEYYTTLGGDVFYQQKTDGTYAKKPWSVLLDLAQRMVVNDAMARYAYQQILSVNGAGVNIASSTDYDPATEKLLDKGVAGYKGGHGVAQQSPHTSRKLGRQHQHTSRSSLSERRQRKYRSTKGRKYRST